MEGLDLDHPAVKKSVTNFLYRHPAIYELAMRALYGGELEKGLHLVAKAIEPGWNVLDVCAGDAAIAAFLPPGVRYTAWEQSEAFVRSMRLRGLESRLVDVSQVAWPESAFDCVMIIRSLYHFIPNAKNVVDGMMRAASKRVVICEPVQNLSNSSNFLIRKLARRLSRIRKGQGEERFSSLDLKSLLSDYGPVKIESVGKDVIAIIDVSS